MLIGLNGFKSAGKNVVGDYLVEQYGFTIVSFAALLKQSAAALFGFEPEIWDEWKNSDAAVVAVFDADGNEHTVVTARKFLQRYGTESHRDVFGYDFWVEQAFKGLNTTTYARYVFTDARFENELQAIYAKGGKNIQIVRPETDGLSGGHASEIRPNEIYLDAVIYNTGTLDNLYDRVDSVISNLFPEIAQ